MNTKRQQLIIETCCRLFGVKVADVVSNRKYRPLPHVRAMIAKAMFWDEKMHPRDIARLINRDRTDVYHLQKLADDMNYVDTRFRVLLGELRGIINNGSKDEKSQ